MSQNLSCLKKRRLKSLLLSVSLAVIAISPTAMFPTNVSAATFTVTNLADDGTSGTLRWAITQANASPGADTISFDNAVAGTITLTSNLPAITETLTISGPGQSNLTIDGANQYSMFAVAFLNIGDADSGVIFTIRDVTLARGGAASGEGEAQFIYNSRATVRATRVTFRNASRTAVSNWGGPSVSTYTDCVFRNNYIGIFGDHGTTPTATTNDESEYTNRTYVVDSLFEDNTQGIYQERWTKITGSTFRNNGEAATINGLNRTQISNSTFSGNTYSISHFNWTPVEWTSVGRSNRLHDGNTFLNNQYAFYLDDSWNDDKRSQQWTTLSNNEWDGSGIWVYATDFDGSTNVGATVQEVQTPNRSWRETNNVDYRTTTTTTSTTTSTSVPTQSQNSQSSQGDSSGDTQTGGGTNQVTNLLTQQSKSTSTTTPRSSSLLVTTTTISSPTTTTTTIPAPTAPNVSSGEAGALVDGEEVETTLSRSNNALVVSAAGIEASIYGMTDDGARVDLDEDGFLRLETSDQIVVEAEGFSAGDEVDVWMYSTPTRLGVAEVDANGIMKATFTLPPGIDSGDHRVVLDGTNGKGQDVTLGVGIAVGEVSQSSLISRLIIIVPVSAAILIALLIPTALKRRREEVSA